jgi:diacylglycerol kinase (ATP)
MLLAINPRAGGGTALGRWRRVEPEVSRDRSLKVEIIDDPRRMPDLVARGIAAGHGTFLAGGGDGTVNALASALVETLGTRRTLGAIGLGSSNDFHKPVRSCFGGVPCRMDAAHSRTSDVGRLVIRDPAGGQVVRYWLVNASVGVTADANLRFNRASGVLARLKQVSTGAAIGYAALATVLRDRGRELAATVDGRAPYANGTGRSDSVRRFRNLAFVKNPNFSGCLRYDSPFEPLSGAFHFHAVTDVPLLRLLLILAGLARGRFAGRAGTVSLEATAAVVSAREPFAVEFDGEVMEAVSIEVSVIPQGLEVCS